MRKISSIIFHCSANNDPNHTVEDVRKLHMASRDQRVFWNGGYVRGKGFSDIGYHYFIEFDASISVGRPESQVGAHVSGWNSHSIGVCHAGFSPNQGQVESYKKLLFRLHKSYWRASLEQHCYFNPYKECPCIPHDTWLELYRYWRVDLE